MKSFFSVILFISFLLGSLRTVSRINEYSADAAVAYRQENYIEAIAAYEYLLGDLGVRDDQIRLNLGHAYFRAGELQKARQQYTLLAEHSSRQIRAVALLQLGTISAQNQSYKQALSHFRQALVVEPGNEAARYNYELIKKLLLQRPELAKETDEDDLPQDDYPHDQTAQRKPEQLPQEEEQSTQAKKKPDNEGDQEAEIETEDLEEEGDQEQNAPGDEQGEKGSGDRPKNQEREETSGREQGDTRGMNPDNSFDPNRPERSRGNEPLSEAEQRAQTRNSRLQQMNINPEKARLMLDAMRSAEQQYIQQLPKKATRKPDPSKPDW